MDIAERMDELIEALTDEINGNLSLSEDDLYGILQVLTERRDEAIARQSVTDEAVRDAIEDIEKCIKPVVGGKSLDLAIKALQQMCTEPTDKDVQDAIEYIETHKETAEACLDYDYEDDARVKKAVNESIGCYDLAITALQQMRTEPCDWCKTHGKTRFETVRVDVQDGVPVDYNADKYVRFTPSHYCPNCGRKLKGE